MKILIQGAGIGGCAAALYLSKLGHNVTVAEKRSQLFTDGAGILLYSNALKYLDKIGVLENVLAQGLPMAGQTGFYNMNSEFIGNVEYQSIDPKYPAYVGIDRTSLLKILYEQSLLNGVIYYFGSSIELSTLTGVPGDAVTLANGVCDTYDLIVACDGINSAIRNKLVDQAVVQYTGYGLWHSLHRRRPEINEKITVIGSGCRIGFIPLNSEFMYAWASMPEPEKIYINPEHRPAAMKQKFSCFTGLIGELIEEIDQSTYVHFTCVNEVKMPKPWFFGNVVFVGDSAHAALPFMAQGGAQALHDVVSLGQWLSRNLALPEALTKYSEFRYNVAKTVQDFSNAIGSSYQSNSVDLNKVKQGLDMFYKNPNNFLLPEELL
jgi:2-polyprenyl-6-methoxyphenol hydroxylase-like FAD-dependent oxidoreductase